MQGRHFYQRKLFTYADLEHFVPQAHFLRKVQMMLDFSSLRAKTSSFYCQQNGRPSIDPELFFRMLLIGYFYGIHSDRQLCEQIHYNLLYRWFCQLSLEDKVPDHSSLTRIRDRLGEKTFQEFFHEILLKCQQAGLLKGESLAVDSTLINANASIKSLKLKEEKADVLPKIVEKKISNETHQSNTDPDATIAKKLWSTGGLKYKVHYMADTQSRVIVDCHVTTGACHDSQPFLKRLQYVKEKLNFKIKEIIADRAYGSAEILSAVIKEEINPYIPLFSSQTGKGVPSVESGFIYNKEMDAYICPENKFIRAMPSIDKGLKVYDISKTICSACPRQKACVPNLKRGKRLRRNIYQDLFDEMKEKMQTSLFKTKLLNRFSIMEGLIAESKTIHGLARAKYRRNHKVQIQAYMTAIVQNIKRLIGPLYPRNSAREKRYLFFLFVQFSSREYRYSSYSF